jgi:uncharacterized MAPEG superfamily protein
MTDDTHMLAYSVMLAWLMIMTAAGLRTRGSFGLAFSNRDALPADTPLTGRADRAAKNMLENLLLFVCAWAATRGAGVSGWKVTRGAQVFFAARCVYWPIYLVGIPVLRTLIWFVGAIGIGLMIWAVLAA